MKKKGILICILLLLTGCTAVRIDTTSIDSTVDIILSKNNNLYNRMGIGYKYYIPKGVTYIDSSEANDKLYSNGVYYYLYLDEVSYYYKTSMEYKEDPSKYYSKKIRNGKKIGYLQITDQKNGKYWIEFVYNYAKIEAMVEKDEIKKTILNSSYILSTIKYNKNIIKLSVDGTDSKSKTKKYDEFTSKKETNNFLIYEEND
jgi:hypothetical protein